MRIGQFRGIRQLWVMAWFACYLSPTWAMVVNPIRVELAPNQPSQTVTVTNDSDRPLSVQLETFDWNGWDTTKKAMQLSPSDVLIANPPAFQLAPKEVQLIRVGLMDAPQGDVQHAYRLFIRELPSLEPKKGATINILVHFSVPVFYTPAAASMEAKLVWRSERQKDGLFRVMVTNEGKSAVRLIDVKPTEGALKISAVGDHNGYVLAGQTLAWLVNAHVGQTLNFRLQQGDGQWTTTHVEVH